MGAVFAGLRFEGVLRGKIRRDGANSARVIVRLITDSKFADHIRLIMIQGIAFGGFNVVDVFYIHNKLNLPVLAVARRMPDFDGIKSALRTRVRGGFQKWRLIERTGPMEPAAGVYVQRAGLTLEEARGVIETFAVHGRIPEPLRTAHLIAGGIALGESKGRA